MTAISARRSSSSSLRSSRKRCNGGGTTIGRRWIVVSDRWRLIGHFEGSLGTVKELHVVIDDNTRRHAAVASEEVRRRSSTVCAAGCGMTWDFILIHSLHMKQWVCWCGSSSGMVSLREHGIVPQFLWNPACLLTTNMTPREESVNQKDN